MLFYSQENSWTEEQLREAWDNHKKECPGEDRILSRSFLIALILKYAPTGVEKFNPFPGKFQTYDLLQEDLNEGYKLAAEKVPGVNTGALDMDLGIHWMVDPQSCCTRLETFAGTGVARIDRTGEKGEFSSAQIGGHGI